MWTTLLPVCLWVIVQVYNTHSTSRTTTFHFVVLPHLTSGLDIGICVFIFIIYFLHQLEGKSRFIQHFFYLFPFNFCCSFFLAKNNVVEFGIKALGSAAMNTGDERKWTKQKNEEDDGII